MSCVSYGFKGRETATETMSSDTQSVTKEGSDERGRESEIGLGYSTSCVSYGFRGRETATTRETQ